LASYFIPKGNFFFTLLSRYDDVLSDVIKRPKYKSGDTLKLILPFLKAYGTTNHKMAQYSKEHILLVSGANEMFDLISNFMPAFIVSTSYEQYIYALCKVINFSEKKTYCTKLDIDKYVLEEEEIKRLKILRQEISEMPMIEISKDPKKFEDLSFSSQDTVLRLNELFFEEIPKMKSGKMLKEVNPVGGYEKSKAVRDIMKRVHSDPSDIIYVGDSITDVDSFKLVKKGGGLTISFNGNQYALRAAEISVLSNNNIVLSLFSELFSKYGKERVINLVEEWSLESLKGFCSKALLDKISKVYSENPPKIERITSHNLDRLIGEGVTFRKTVRGEEIGKLG
jgi:energy-converting hydrogenase A subunit R